MRLHGDKVIYTSGYTSRALDEWAQRIREWHRRGDVYVYFDNDVKIKAPYDTQALMRKLGEDKRWSFNRPAHRRAPDANRTPSRTRTGGIPARR